jgi:hypothetical protein
VGSEEVVSNGLSNESGRTGSNSGDLEALAMPDRL